MPSIKTVNWGKKSWYSFETTTKDGRVYWDGKFMTDGWIAVNKRIISEKIIQKHEWYGQVEGQTFKEKEQLPNINAVLPSRKGKNLLEDTKIVFEGYKMNRRVLKSDCGRLIFMDNKRFSGLKKVLDSVITYYDIHCNADEFGAIEIWCGDTLMAILMPLRVREGGDIYEDFVNAVSMIKTKTITPKTNYEEIESAGCAVLVEKMTRKFSFD